MDNLTHTLIGIASSKAGLERLSPYTTAVCVVAANAPDADFLVRTFAGDWAYLHHHRGITHSILGTMIIAFLIPGFFYILDLIIRHFRVHQPRPRFTKLLVVSLLLSASHPLLDWTNNYGVRPLLPWSGEWFYGDLVFIIDPFMWLTLGGAAFLATADTGRKLAAWALLAAALTCAVLILPQRLGQAYPLLSRWLWLAAIIGFVFVYRRKAAVKYTRQIACAALCLVVVYWSGLALLHRRAVMQAQAAMTEHAAARGEQFIRLAAMPVLANPLRWNVVAETNQATYQFNSELNNQAATRQNLAAAARFAVPTASEQSIIEQAKNDERTGILLDFARFPVALVTRNCADESLVQFADVRYAEPGANRRGQFALNVSVTPTR